MVPPGPKESSSGWAKIPKIYLFCGKDINNNYTRIYNIENAVFRDYRK